MRKSILATLAVLFALAFAAPAFAQIPGLDMSSDVKNYISQALPPYLGVVSQDPAEPAADTEVTITASAAPIKIFEEVDPLDVGEVILYYTIDGGQAWEEVAMDQNGELFTAVIPGQPAGTTVNYYVRAYSDVGNISIDASGRQIDLNIGQTQSIEVIPAAGGAPSGDDPFANLQLIVNDGETPEAAASADLLEARIGRDDTNLYIRLVYKSKIDGGKLTPLLARLYLGIMFNLYRDFEDFDANNEKMDTYIEKFRKLIPFQDQDSLAKEGAKRVFIWLWAPLMDAVPALPGIGKIPKESIIKLNASNISVPIFDTSVKAKVTSAGTVDITIPRESLGYADTDSMFFLFGDGEVSGNLADISNLQFKFPDIGSPTIVKFTDHGYTIPE